MSMIVTRRPPPASCLRWADGVGVNTSFEYELSLSSSALGSVLTTLYDATAEARRTSTHEQTNWTAQSPNIQSVTQDRISNAPSLSPVYTAAHTHENSYPYTPLPNCP